MVELMSASLWARILDLLRPAIGPTSCKDRKNECHIEDPMAQLVVDFSLPQSRKRLSSFI